MISVSGEVSGSLLQVRSPVGRPLLLYKDLNVAMSRLLYIFILVFNVSGDSAPGATAGSGLL